jgi:hypothetical protein
MIHYLKLLWRLCGKQVLEVDEHFREMLEKAGWRRFQIEIANNGGPTSKAQLMPTKG